MDKKINNTQSFKQFKKFKNRFAVYIFCADYHSGQWSRLYRLLCMCGKSLKRAGCMPSHEDFDILQDVTRSTKIYLDLESKIKAGKLND